MPTTMTAPIVRRLLEAEGFLELGLPAKALDVLRSRAEWATVQFEACFLSGEALRQLGRYREALEALEVAARLRPADPRVAIAQGWCYKRTHRLAQAIDALERVLRATPDDGLLRYNLACYWSLAGDPARCIGELAAALKLAPRLRLLIPDEPDFEAVRGLPAFARLLGDEAARLS